MVDVKEAVGKARGYLEDMYKIDAASGDLRSMRSRKGE
jgi:hypothetical protein